MTQYNILNVKLSNLQLNILKSGIKNGAEVTLKLSSNVAGYCNDENNFPHKLLLTKTQVSRLRKAFANNSSASIKLSKTQLHKIGKSGEFSNPTFRIGLPGLPLMENVLKPLAKSVLVPLGLTASASATDAAIHKKMFGSGVITLIISKEEINDFIKIVRRLEESGLLIKNVSETIKNEAKEQKGGFIGMLLSFLGAREDTIRAVEDSISADKDKIRAAQDF